MFRQTTIGGIALFMAACSIPPIQPTKQDDLNCKVQGLVFRDLGVMRDEGHDIPRAVAAVREKYQGLALSSTEKIAAAYVLSGADTTTKFVYALKTLYPVTLMYYGANVCLMIASGNRDPENAVVLAQYALACQRQYQPDSAEAQLRRCITDEAIRLATKAKK